MSSNDFWVKLRDSWQDENKKYDLKKMNNYDFSVHNYSEKEIISYIFSDIENFNLFISNDYSEESIISYEKLFLNITMKKEIDYSIFFTELKSKNLLNLKKSYFEALKFIYINNGKKNIMKERIVKDLEKRKKYFSDDFDVVLDILNSDLDIELKKSYISFSSTPIKEYFNFIKNKEVLEWLEKNNDKKNNNVNVYNNKFSLSK